MPMPQAISEPDERAEPASEMREITLRIDGMVCAGCAATVQKALESQSNVISATVSYQEGQARIRGRGLDPASLIETVRGRGYEAEPAQEEFTAAERRTEIEERQDRAERQWRFRAIVGLGVWIPLEALHWTAYARDWHGIWLPLVMLAGSSAVFVVAGWGFYRSAINAARKLTTNMDTLIAIGATTAYVFSLVVFLAQQFGRLTDQPLYFAEAAALLGIISLGHWLEARAASKAGSSVRELLELQPDEAELIEAEDDAAGDSPRTRRIASAEIQPDAQLLIRPGSRVPVDGVVIQGESEVDESVVTGEPMPVAKGVDDEVIAGSMNTTGRLVVRATVDGRHTTVSRIADLVRKAQTSKAEIQRLADRVSAIFVPTVLTIAAMTFLGWWLIMQAPVTGVIASVTVLIISCPCALGLATPMAVMVGTGEASMRGILIKSAAALEQASRLTTVIFDKTGTLTAGQPVVTNVSPTDSNDEATVLHIAAAVEQPSEHPIARAIVRAIEERGLRISHVERFSAIPGEGVRGTVDGRSVEVRRDEQANCHVTVDGTRIGTITVEDTVREDAAAAIARLREMGLEVILLTGDRQAAAERIAGELGIDVNNVVAGATPERKSEFVREHAGGVIMVGDGINDAAALAEADLGIAMASGTNVAIESAHVVIPGDRVVAVPETIDLSRRTLRTIRQNLFLAFVYNSLAIPAAALYLLGPYGPLIAAAAMGLSDVSVIGNALRLKAALRQHRR